MTISRVLLLGVFMIVHVVHAQTEQAIFDFNVGDVFQYHVLNDLPPAGSQRTVVSKTVDEVNNQVTYVFDDYTYYSQVVWDVEPYLEFFYSSSTNEVTYGYSDEPITEVEDGFLFDTLYFETFLSCPAEGIGYNYCIGDFEPECFHTRYAAGLGEVYNYYSWAGAPGMGSGLEMVYYNKGGVECGVYDVNLSIRTIPSVILSVFPNPATDEVKVTGNIRAGALYRLVEMSGREITSGMISAVPFVLETITIPAGFYVLMIADDRQHYRAEVIIE